MSNTAAGLSSKIASADDLAGVVRTMKAIAASGIAQYENAVRSLDDYYRTVQLGLAASLRDSERSGDTARPSPRETGAIGAIVLGSDQGLVGQFNEAIVDFVAQTLRGLPGRKIIWAVGERIQSRLADTQMQAAGSFVLPSSINAITPLVGQVLIEMESQRAKGAIGEVYLFHNGPGGGETYVPVSQRLLPLDELWRQDLLAIRWPTPLVPEVINERARSLSALVGEYLFVALFRACAESLASENASRLAAMQRAEKNIDELLDDLKRRFYGLRQSAIDEELFDVVSGFEALTAQGASDIDRR